MTHDMPNARVWTILIALLVCNVAIIVLWTRECYCETCENRFAIWERQGRQVCRSCAKIHDRYIRRNRQRCSLPWRLWRKAS